MKPLKPLLALFCIALAASPAAASVLFKGLQYSSVGSAVVDVGADRKLTVSNLGSSGQDGVSVSCLHMDGSRLSLDGSCTSADAGASLSYTFTVTVSGTALLPRMRVSCACSPGYLDITPTLNELSSSPTQTVTLSRGGVVVYTADVPVSTSARVSMDATGACPNPALSCSVDRKAHAVHRGASFSSVVHMSVAGHGEECDDVDFSSALDPADEDCDGVSSDLRVSCPQGSSFSVVRCADGSCRALDHFVSGAGQVQLDLATAATTGRRRLEVHNLGSSGQDGVSISRAPGSGGGGGGGSAVDCAFAMPSLLFDPATDLGSSATITIVGNSFSSSGVSSPASVSMQLTLSGGPALSGALLHVTCDHSGMGASAESVAVFSNGVEVRRCALPPGVGLSVSAPPGSPEAFMIASAGKTHTKTGHVTLMKAPMLGAIGAGSPGVNSTFTDSDDDGTMEVSFRCSRAFTVDASPPTIGDRIVFWGGGSCSSGACDAFVASSSELRVTCPSSSSSSSSLSLDDFTSSSGDQIFADVSGSSVLSPAHACVTVPFRFSRVDQTPVRAYSVRFHVSPELARCATSVVEGDYLSRIADTQMFVTDNGGGSFTVDCAILGAVCGATDSGTLFSVDFSSALQPPVSGEGVVTVDQVRVRDCVSNAPVAASPGGSSYVQMQYGAPPAVTGLTATTQKTGNLTVSGTPGGSVATIVVRFSPSTKQYVDDCFRAPFGNYPLYDKGTSPGHAPTPPASESAALSSGWTPVTCSSGACDGSGLLDLPPGRDFYYYVVFARDAFGNVSPASSMTTGTLDYHLGDVSDGLAVCSGDNLVDITDISALGAHYGSHVLSNASWTCLDVGPTTDFSVDTRPTVDGMVEFEDLMMYAMNFSVVSAPASSRRPVAAATNASQLVVPTLPAPGQTFDAGVVVDGAGDLQGVSIRLAYDPNVLEQVGVVAGSLLGQQDRASAVLSSGPGDVDVALLGRGAGIAGHGELARVTFRVKGAGDPQLAIASLNGRGSDNLPVAIAGAVGGTSLPAHSALGFAYPNPFRQSLAFQLSLHSAGPAAVGVFDVAGRRVRTLVQGTQPAGSRIVTWDGRDDSGIQLAPGAYIVRLEASGLRESRAVRLVR